MQTQNYNILNIPYSLPIRFVRVKSDRNTPVHDPKDLPIPSKKWTTGKFKIKNDGVIRSPLEVEFRNEDGTLFKGNITTNHNL